jgi:hypothetical protein
MIELKDSRPMWSVWPDNTMDWISHKGDNLTVAMPIDTPGPQLAVNFGKTHGKLRVQIFLRKHPQAKDWKKVMDLDVESELALMELAKL